MTGDARNVADPTPAAHPAGLPRALRLTGPADYQRVYRTGGRLELKYLVVRFLRTDLPGSRFGLAVSRKVGNAVVRNRVKRWIREAVRHERHGVAGADAVLIARSSAGDAGAEAIRADVARAMSRLRSLR